MDKGESRKSEKTDMTPDELQNVSGGYGSDKSYGPIRCDWCGETFMEREYYKAHLSWCKIENKKKKGDPLELGRRPD